MCARGRWNRNHCQWPRAHAPSPVALCHRLRVYRSLSLAVMLKGLSLRAGTAIMGQRRIAAHFTQHRAIRTASHPNAERETRSTLCSRRPGVQLIAATGGQYNTCSGTHAHGMQCTFYWPARCEQAQPQSVSNSRPGNFCAVQDVLANVCYNVFEFPVHCGHFFLCLLCVFVGVSSSSVRASLGRARLNDYFNGTQRRLAHAKME